MRRRHSSVVEPLPIIIPNNWPQAEHYFRRDHIRIINVLFLYTHECYGYHDWVDRWKLQRKIVKYELNVIITYKSAFVFVIGRYRDDEERTVDEVGVSFCWRVRRLYTNGKVFRKNRKRDVWSGRYLPTTLPRRRYIIMRRETCDILTLLPQNDQRTEKPQQQKLYIAKSWCSCCRRFSTLLHDLLHTLCAIPYVCVRVCTRAPVHLLDRKRFGLKSTLNTNITRLLINCIFRRAKSRCWAIWDSYPFFFFVPSKNNFGKQFVFVEHTAQTSRQTKRNE